MSGRPPFRQKPPQINGDITRLAFPSEGVQMPLRKRVGRRHVLNALHRNPKQGGEWLRSTKDGDQVAHGRDVAHGRIIYPKFWETSTKKSLGVHFPTFGNSLFLMAEDRRLEGIASRLRRLREVYGLSQTAMANSIGAPLGTYNNYEKAVSQPRLDYARKIVDEYGVTLDWIYDGRKTGLSMEMVQRLSGASSSSSSAA